MATQLQVHASLLGLFQMVRLVVQQNGVVAVVNTLHQLLHTLAAAVAAVITSHNGHVADDDGAVSQDADSCFVQQVKRFVDARDILMVAQAGEGGGVEAFQLLDSPLCLQWPHIAVDQVTGDENEVSLLGIDHIDPSAHFGTAIVESGMQVAQHDDL